MYGYINETFLHTQKYSLLVIFLIIHILYSIWLDVNTVSFPDVMIGAYEHTRWAAILFLFYVCSIVYIFMNLVRTIHAFHISTNHNCSSWALSSLSFAIQLLAAVFDAYSIEELSKLKKLYLHRRRACARAFRLLATDRVRPSFFLFVQSKYLNTQSK